MSRKYQLWPLFPLLLLPFAFGAAGQTKSTEGGEAFPMSVGTSWTYRGIVRWGEDIEKPSEAKVEWKMEIRRLIHHGEYTAAVVSGPWNCRRYGTKSGSISACHSVDE